MCKVKFIFFLLFAIYVKSLAQNSSNLSIENDIKTAFNFKDGEDVFHVWDSITHHNQNYYDVISDEAWIPPLEYYYFLAVKNNDSVLAFKLRYPLAYIYHTTTRFEKCIPLLKQVVLFKKKIEPDIYSMVLLKLEECYVRIAELKPALDIRKLRVHEGLVDHYWEIYKEAELFEYALKDYRLHEHLLEKDDWGKIFYYSNLGGLFKKNNQLDSAEFYYIKAQKACQIIINDTNYTGKSHYSEYVKFYMKSLMMGNIAQIHMKRGFFRKAIPLLKEDIEKSKSIAEISNAIIKRFDLAECYLNLKESKLAKRYIDTSANLMKVTKLYYYDFRLFKLNADYYYSVNQFDSAYFYLNKYLTLKETINERLKRNKTLILLTMLDTDKQKATVSNQKLEIEAIKLKVSEQKRLRNLLYSGIILLILLVIFGAFYSSQKNKRRKEIEQSLIEKEVLLKEIHHRVKNNLTTLKSLLYLQAKASKNIEVKNVLEECQLRIQSMALIHQNLYEEGENQEIEFSHFVEQLFDSIDLSFKPDNTNVKIQINCHNIHLDMSTALFLGLILNELVTNSYKYAFQDKFIGKIGIDITKIEKKISVIYFDDGVGLKNGFNDEIKGFGFKLIRILSQQINAKLVYENKNQLSTFYITLYE